MSEVNKCLGIITKVVFKIKDRTPKMHAWFTKLFYNQILWICSCAVAHRNPPTTPAFLSGQTQLIVSKNALNYFKKCCIYRMFIDCNFNVWLSEQTAGKKNQEQKTNTVHACLTYPIVIIICFNAFYTFLLHVVLW